MKDHHDVSGHGVYDYLNGVEGFEIVERDDGNIVPSGGPKVYFSPYKDWPAIEKKAMRYVQGRVLDVGCGAGRHSLYLQKKGLQVVGIDNSPLAIEVCKRRGLNDSRVMSIGQVSSRLGMFDTILMLGGNFGLFGNIDRGRRLLRRFARITTRRARIVATTVDPYDTNDSVHLEYHERNRSRGRMPGQVRCRVRYKKYCSPWFDWLIVSRDEMRDMLDGTGWRLRRTIDGEGGRYIGVIGKV